MKSRRKRFFKRLFKIGKIPFLIGIGLLIGIAISGSSHEEHHSVIIENDGRFHEEIVHDIEQRIEEQIEHRIEDRIVNEIVIPPIPDIPDIPEIPDLPDFDTKVYIDNGPSFWDVLNGAGTILASLILVGLGGKMLIQRRRQPKEKSPESVNV